MAKTKEMPVGFRGRAHAPLPIINGGETVELVTAIKYLALYLTSDLTWAENTASVVKKAQQRLYFMRLTQAGLSAAGLFSFYSCAGKCPDLWHNSLVRQLLWV